MHDPEYDSLIQRDYFFRVPDVYDVIDIATDSDIRRVRQDGPLTESEVLVWLARTVDKAEPVDEGERRLQAILLPPADSGYARIIACARSVYQCMVQSWGLPKEVFRIIVGNSGMFMSLQEPYNSGQPHRIGLAYFGYERQVCAFIDLQSKRTCLFHAPRSRDPDMFTHFERERSTIRSALLDDNEVDVVGIILLLLELDYSIARTYTENIFNMLQPTRVALKLSPFAESAYPELLGPEATKATEQWHPQPESPENDLVTHMRTLTNLAQRASMVRSSVLATVRILNALRDLHGNYERLTAGTALQYRPGQSSCLQRRFDLLETNITGVAERLQRRSNEIQAAMQTLYSLIAVRDNEASLQVARSSTFLAEESMRLADLAYKDSADMRIIAAVTLLFLPATFMATLFSTSFFDFQPGNERVSSWIWLYWTITALLTAAVLVAWRLTSKRFGRMQGRREQNQK